MKNDRESQRSVIEIDVRLYENSNFLALGRAINHSPCGMFIRTNSLLHPRGSSLNVSFNTPESAAKCSFKAKVMHRTINGIGVQFQHQLSPAI